MVRIHSVVILIFLIRVAVVASPDTLKHQRRVMVMPRFNTLNMAPVSGNIVNRHVNMDVTLTYAKNNFLWTVVNGADLEDPHSEMNYFLTNVRYRVKLSNTLRVSPFLAFYSEHAHQLIDPISDANAGMILAYQRGGLTIEAFGLLVRLTHPIPEKDIINRLEIKYSWKPMVVSLFVFQNTSYLDDKGRLAVGFKTLLPVFLIFNKIPTRSEVTGSFRIWEKPETKNLSGVFLSLAFPLSYSF